MRFRTVLSLFAGGFAALVGLILWTAFRDHRPPPDPGPPPREALCRYDSYCVGEDCSAEVPADFRILENGRFGRTYLGPIGKEGAQVSGAPPGEDGGRRLYKSAGERDGVDLFHVWMLYPDGHFDFRVTERLVDNPAIETATGSCGAFTVLPRT